MLPIAVLVFGQKRPVNSFVLAVCFLFIGIVIVQAIFTVDYLRASGGNAQDSIPGILIFAVLSSKWTILKGVMILLPIHFVRRLFYKKAALRRRAKTAFE